MKTRAGAILASLTFLCACHREPARTADQIFWDSVAAGPRWVLLTARTGDILLWFDHQSIVRRDSVVYEAWTRSVLRQQDMGLRTRNELDCRRKMLRILEEAQYDIHGNLVSSERSTDTLWRAVPDASNGDAVLRAVCPFAASRNLPVVRR